MKTSFLAAALVLVAGTARAADYDLDASHSNVEFSVKHMMVSTVHGNFPKFTGSVSLDDKDVTKSTVQVKIDAASIDTREAQRDAHLKSPDFFDTTKFPEISFKSTRVEAAGAGRLKVTGDLTMHGVTKPVTLEVEGPTPEFKNPWGQMVRGFSATAKLNRKDFGLTWNKALEAGGVLVGEEITITIDAEVKPKAPAAEAKTK